MYYFLINAISRHIEDILDNRDHTNPEYFYIKEVSLQIGWYFSDGASENL